eukprot:Opistho-1_new@19828
MHAAYVIVPTANMYEPVTAWLNCSDWLVVATGRTEKRSAGMPHATAAPTTRTTSTRVKSVGDASLTTSAPSSATVKTQQRAMCVSACTRDLDARRTRYSFSRAASAYVSVSLRGRIACSCRMARDPSPRERADANASFCLNMTIGGPFCAPASVATVATVATEPRRENESRIREGARAAELSPYRLPTALEPTEWSKGGIDEPSLLSSESGTDDATVWAEGAASARDASAAGKSNPWGGRGSAGYKGFGMAPGCGEAANEAYSASETDAVGSLSVRRGYITSVRDMVECEDIDTELPTR